MAPKLTFTAAVLATTLVAATAPARAGVVKPAASFGDELVKHTFPLTVTHGVLGGAGADVLRPAIDDATFVMLGEDHGIEQIPTLAAALCAELAPHGFRRLALEVGPSVAPTIATIAAAKDAAAQMKAFDARYPETVAFYDWREDLGFVSSCAKAVAAQQASLEIWGVDQELMGASQLLLDQILDTRPGADAAAAIAKLAAEARTDRAAAVKSGDFSQLFMMAADDQALTQTAQLLAQQGSAAAQAILARLAASRVLYQGQMGRHPYVSNTARAQLMKDAFFGALSAAAQKDKAMPKVLMKMGAWHLYRGMNPLRSAELGNLVTEAAAAHDVKAVNVLVLGVTGKQLQIEGPSKAAAVPLDLRKADSDYAFLALFFAAQIKGGYTLFDLRALRPDYDDFGPLDKELERTIFGYDFLVLVADPRPEHPL